MISERYAALLRNVREAYRQAGTLRPSRWVREGASSYTVKGVDMGRVSAERAGKFAGRMADNLKRLGPDGWGITMAILIDMAKHHSFTRERLLSAVGRAWDAWVD